MQDKEDAAGLLRSGEGRCDQVEEQIIESDESEAFEEAAADLVRLDRYERRACARQRRAINAFMNIRLMKQLSAPASALFSSPSNEPCTTSEGNVIVIAPEVARGSLESTSGLYLARRR